MKTLDVVIPVLNEETALSKSIAELHTFLTENMKPYNWKIIIVDNGSTDETLARAENLADKYPKIELRQLEQKGRGRALKAAWEESKADFVSYMDVDLSSQLAFFPKLVEGLEKGYDIAIGSRLLPGSKVIGRTLKRELISRSYNLLIKFLFRTKFSDAQCGFKALNFKSWQKLSHLMEDNAWFLDSEILIVGEKAGMKIWEVPVVWVDDPGSTVKVMKTAKGDLLGLWRLFWLRPWKKIL